MTRQPFQTTYTENILVGYDRADGNLTFESRDFACSIASGGVTVHLRESPTLPSYGRSTKRQCMYMMGHRGRTEGFMVESFFDIFLEVSTDGLVWSPRSNLLRFSLEPLAEQDNAFATDFLPPRDGAFVMEPGAPPVNYWTSPLIRDMTLDGFETSQRPPTAMSTSIIACRCRCEISFDGGQTWTPRELPASVTLQWIPDGSGGGYDAEVLDFTLIGPDFLIRESPTRASTGRTSIRSKSSGYEANGFIIDSFFDIFTEISTDGGGTWTPAENACRLRATRLPRAFPTDQTWSPPARMTHRAVDPEFELPFAGTATTISGLIIDSASAVNPDGPPPAVASGGINQRTCTCPNGYYVKSNLSTVRRPQHQFGWVYWTEQNSTSQSSRRTVDLELGGLNLCSDVPGLLLRESPTRASTGRSSLVTRQDGLLASSFFDVFLELSEDGGQTWHPALAPLQMEAVDASRPQRFGTSGGASPLPTRFKSPRTTLKSFFETGDKPTQVQFGDMIDSTISLIDDAQFSELRHYDAELEYESSGTGSTNRRRGQLTFGTILWRDPRSTDARTIHQVEITQFDMSGGTMPAGMLLRESPTLPSRGRCERIVASNGTSTILSFFDVFLEISHDNGTTWRASDLPLHFVHEQVPLATMTHSDHFVPQTVYRQSLTPIRCPDGSCALTQCSFTSPPAPLPTNPGDHQLYPQITGQLTSFFTHPSGQGTPVSADFEMAVNLTLLDTVGPTSHFEAEVLGLMLTGTVSPAEFRLRESPTRASLGRHTVTNAGGGNYLVSSFFDIWTEISIDGGQTWSECDVPLRLELSASELDVQLEPSVNLVAGVSSIDFGHMLIGGNATRNILVSNNGNAMLSDFGLSIIGTNAADFTTAPISITTLIPGKPVLIPITFTAGTAGTRTATLRITSNDGDEAPFDITLNARALSPGADDDNDGLTNEQETNIVSNPLYSGDGQPVTNPLFDDSARLSFYRDNGLYLASDVHAMNVDTPLLERLPGTNQFRLTIGLQKSTTLLPGSFQPFPMSAPQTMINGAGNLEFLFTDPDDAAFFRLQSK